MKCLRFVINIDLKIISFLTVRKQFVLNLEVLLFRGMCFSDGVRPELTDKVRHLGNFIDTTCTDYIDCITKMSYFIGYVKQGESYGENDT